MSEQIEESWGDDASAVVEVVVKPKKAKVVKGATETGPGTDEERIKIILEENENIPPSGQFVSVNGYGYLIKPGVEVSVPESVLEVLDNAIMSFPVKDENDAVVGYRDKLRFAYRIVRDKKPRPTA